MSVFTSCFKGVFSGLSGGLDLTRNALFQEEVDLNGRTLRVARLLGEGGYSFVYLAKDVHSGKEFALKKMICQSSEQLEMAKREIDVMHRFKKTKCENLLQLVDSSFEEGGGHGGAGGKAKGRGRSGSRGENVVNLLFEAYKEGTVLDLVEAAVASKHSLSPRLVLSLFLQVCRAVKAMHELGGKEGPLAHRDIKPHNVLLSSENAPSAGGMAAKSFLAVLMDFGSTRSARITVTSRQEALKCQEEAEAHSTGTYRPPELFDTPSNCSIDERTDIWSLGCLLYYMCYGESPFEYVLNEAGGSLALAVMSGKVAWPDHGVGYHPLIVDLIKECLVQDIEARPFIQPLMESTEKAIASLD